MAHVKRGVTAHARHKKVLNLAKGYRGRAKSSFRIAIEKVEKGLRYAYRDRRVKKRNFRALWIQRINAGVRAEGLTYSQFMNGVKRAGLALDRKVLADLAMHEPETFRAIVAQAQAALAPA
jgi:large subunit ribosomal protein L20